MIAEHKSLPEHGLPAEGVLSTMAAQRAQDANWQQGRVWSLVFHPGDELSDFVKQAYTLFFSENGLNPSAFPSLRKFETEVVAMTGDLLGGDREVVGNMTSGGTESILMAVKAARQWARVRNPELGRPEMVLPVTAHPAFEKAAHYFGVRAVRVPVGKDFRADVRAAKKAITKRTILMVGSAPSYPQGVVDPIHDLARVAQYRQILFHVDACVGGMMLPFVRVLGYKVPPWDFSVPGVTSISVDLHKYGYAAKGASVVLYRDSELRKHQYFAYTDWPGGIYASPTMTGTRPGGAIAAAWAIMHRLGFAGYREIAKEVMGATRRIQAGVEEIDGVEVLGRPQMSVMALGSDKVDIYDVGDELAARGWHLDRQQFPPSLHLTVSRGHVAIADQFLADLREAVAASRKEPLHQLFDRSKVKLVGTMARVLPSGLVSTLTAKAGAILGVEGAKLPRRSAAMYGMMAELPNRGDLKTLVIDILDKMTRPDKPDWGGELTDDE